MSTVKERLQEFLREEGISASEFAQKMNLSPSYLASMRKSMPEEKIERLCELYPQINRDWLQYGEGEMYRDMGNSGIDPHKLHRHMVPLVPTQAEAGTLGFYADGYTEEDCVKVYSPRDDAQMAIYVKGDSMEPQIHDGALLFLQRIDAAVFIPWGVPLVIDTTNGSVVKMLYPSEKGEEYLEARSYNKEYPPFHIPKENILGVYKILFQMEEGYTF